MLIAKLFDRQTNEEIEHRDDNEGRWTVEGAEFAFSEGNYSCDCNRSLFFQRAKGFPETDILKSSPDGKELVDKYASNCNVGPNRFVVLSLILHGEVIYEEER